VTPSGRAALIASIKGHEGTGPMKHGRFFLYQDTVGKWTGGWGHNFTDKGMSPAVVDLLLNEDIDEAVRAAAGYPWFVDLDEVRQAIIAEMIFNIGSFGFSTFKRLIHSMATKNYTQAATQMRQSLWAAQVKGRAETLAKRMETGKD